MMVEGKREKRRPPFLNAPQIGSFFGLLTQRSCKEAQAGED